MVPVLNTDTIEIFCDIKYLKVDLLEEFVDRVPHLGGGDVLSSGLGVSASCSLDAGQFAVFS